MAEQSPLRRENPMRNDVVFDQSPPRFDGFQVVSRLSEFCSSADLPSFRLVCKQWNRLSRKRFKAARTLDFYKKDVKGHKNIELWRWLQQELRDWDLATPWRSIRLFLDLSDHPWVDCHYCFNSAIFWTKQGKWLHKLDLCFRLCSPGGLKPLKRAIFELTPNLRELNLQVDRDSKLVLSDDGEGEEVRVQPNLKTLGVNVIPDQFMPLTWTLLFAHFPNVERLSVLNMHAERHLESLAYALEEQGRKQGQLSLKTLTVKLVRPDTEAVLKLLMRVPELELKGLEVDIGECGIDRSSLLSAILNFQGPTLETLVLNYLSCGHPLRRICTYNQFYLEACQSYSALSVMSLHGPLSTNFHFLNHFPNLTFLALHKCLPGMLRGTVWRSMTSLTLPLLREFHFSSLTTPVPIVAEFVRWMPNLELLFVKVPTPELRLVFQIWGSSRVLVAYCVPEHQDPDLIDFNQFLKMPNFQIADMENSLSLALTSRVALVALGKQFAPANHPIPEPWPQMYSSF